jgi:hypothetical protein
MPEYTPEQRAAFSFTALEKGDWDAWRKIDARRLSFTEPEWAPLQQIYGSLAEGLRSLLIIPGDTAALGFAALDPADAERLRKQWKIFLTQEDRT